MLTVKAAKYDTNKTIVNKARKWADASALVFYDFNVDKSNPDQRLVKLGSYWGGWGTAGNNTVVSFTRFVPCPTTNSKSKSKMHPNLGRRPCGVHCDHCHKETTTIVEDRIGAGTIIAIIAIVVMFWLLSWLPLCMSSCKRTHHFCAVNGCKENVGVTHVCA